VPSRYGAGYLYAPNCLEEVFSETGRVAASHFLGNTPYAAGLMNRLVFFLTKR
jgi:hypothetical protein